MCLEKVEPLVRVIFCRFTLRPRSFNTTAKIGRLSDNILKMQQNWNHLQNNCNEKTNNCYPQGVCLAYF